MLFLPHEGKYGYNSSLAAIPNYSVWVVWIHNPNYSKWLYFSHTKPISPPQSSQSPSVSCRRKQQQLPTSAEAPWMMSNGVGEWGHYRDAKVWIGAQEASFVPHSRLSLTTKVHTWLAAGETGRLALLLVSASVFWRRSRAEQFGEGSLQCSSKCWMCE